MKLDDIASFLVEKYRYGSFLLCIGDTPLLYERISSQVSALYVGNEELSLEEWTHTLTNNLTGTFLKIKYAVPYLKKQGGSVVITSSVNGTRVFSNTGATAYSVTKAGEVALAKMLAVKLAPHNVRVNVVCPGRTETEINENTQKRDVDRVKFPVEYPKGPIPLDRGEPATSQEVAELVLFLVSDAARRITGTEVWIDGGSSLITG